MHDAKRNHTLSLYLYLYIHLPFLSLYIFLLLSLFLHLPSPPPPPSLYLPKMTREQTATDETHLPVDKRVEDHEAEERDEVHDEEVHPHDVHLLVIVVLAELRRNHDHEGEVLELAHLFRGAEGGD